MFFNRYYEKVCIYVGLLIKTQLQQQKQIEKEKRKTFKGKYFMLFKCVLYYILTVINFISGYLWVFCVLLLLRCRERQAKSVFFLLRVE